MWIVKARCRAARIQKYFDFLENKIYKILTITQI